MVLNLQHASHRLPLRLQVRMKYSTKRHSQAGMSLVRWKQKQRHGTDARYRWDIEKWAGASAKCGRTIHASLHVPEGVMHSATRLQIP